MEQAFSYAFSVFTNFLSLMFLDFTFTAYNYTVSVGWIIFAALIIGMVINSILNIPSMMPNRVFMSENDRFNRASKSSLFRSRVNSWAGSHRGLNGEYDFRAKRIEVGKDYLDL